MAKSFVDHKCRTGIPGVPGLGSVVNRTCWGEDAAVKRGYTSGVKTYAPPPDHSLPQDPVDKPEDRNYNACRDDWRRGANEDATTKSNFDARGKDGYPKKW